MVTQEQINEMKERRRQRIQAFQSLAHFIIHRIWNNSQEKLKKAKKIEKWFSYSN